MLIVRPSESSERAKRYFGESLKRDDYYIDGQEIAGCWFGKGAPMLGLSGEVDQKNYFALCDNLKPATGAQLTPRQKQDRRPMFDWTFSAPKAVSVLYELSGDDRILDAFQASYRETLEDAEREMKTRVRIKGSNEDRVTGNLVGAEFIHFTARPVKGKNDPHLHAHCVIFNTTFDNVEGRWKASQQGDLKRDADYWESAFHARFAKRLNGLGFATKRQGTSFTLAGLPQSITDEFSKRRNQIEAEAAAKGVTDSKEKHRIGARIREAKNKQLGKEELRRQWSDRLSDDERAAVARVIAGKSGAGDAPITPAGAIDYSLQHSFVHASSVAEKRLRAEALRFGVGSVLPEDVADIAQHREAIAVPHEGQLFVTTKKVLNDEIAYLQFAKDGQRKFRPFMAKWAMENPENTGTRDALVGLSDEQKKGALHILNSPDQVVGLRGGAGTGKTHMLQTVNAVITSIERRSGDYSHVYAFAQSTTASRGELRKVGFKDAETLAMLLKSEKIQAAVHKQVILIDEAGLLSSKDMRAVFDIAKKQDARVILVGDYRQHSSVEAGDAFRLIEKEAGVRYAELKEIRRQKLPGYKKAVEAMAKGSGKAAQEGFDKLDKMGWVKEAEGEDRHRALVKDYLDATAEGKSALIVSPSNAEARRLTEELRATLKENGAIGQERTFTVRSAMKWSEPQKGDVRNYEPGMVIDFHQAVAGQRVRKAGQRITEGGFEKGETSVVSGVTADAVTVMRQDGTTATLPLAMRERFQVSRAREVSVGRGDRIRITKNAEAKVADQAKGTKVSNGDTFTVEGFTKEGDIRLENGKLLPRNFSHWDLGYVDTSYKSQGKTVDFVFIAVGNESLPAANQQQWYVSASRGRAMARLYVDSKEDVRNAIARTGQRLSAVELTGTRLRDSWAKRFSQSFERIRIGRFLKNRANDIADYWKERGRQKDVSYG